MSAFDACTFDSKRDSGINYWSALLGPGASEGAVCVCSDGVALWAVQLPQNQHNPQKPTPHQQTSCIKHRLLSFPSCTRITISRPDRGRPLVSAVAGARCVEWCAASAFRRRSSGVFMRNQVAGHPLAATGRQRQRCRCPGYVSPCLPSIVRDVDPCPPVTPRCPATLAALQRASKRARDCQGQLLQDLKVCRVASAACDCACVTRRQRGSAVAAAFRSGGSVQTLQVGLLRDFDNRFHYCFLRCVYAWCVFICLARDTRELTR